jgi:hypothetical protein
MERRRELDVKSGYFALESAALARGWAVRRKTGIVLTDIGMKT